MNKVNKAVFDASAQCDDIMNHLIKEKTTDELKIDIPAGYEFVGVDDDKQQVVFHKIRPEYPEAYVGVAESPAKTFTRINEFEVRASYRR